MPGLEFRVLGPLEVRRNDEAIAVTAPKQRALLTLLLLRANRPVAQDELIDRLWDGDVPRTARASLQNHIHALRSLLGPSVLDRDAAGYVVHVEPGQLDLDRFERLVADARHAGPRERAAKLRDALACWHGSPAVEIPAAQAEFARLEERRLAALEDKHDAELELGRDAELVAELEELVARYPLRERIWAQLMLALYRAGRQADALAAYRQAHDAFAEELGVEPGVALRDLQRAILIQDPSLHEHDRWFRSTLARAAAVAPKRRRERAELLYEYGYALIQLGEWSQSASALRAAEQMAAAAGERAIVERARLRLAYVSIFLEAADPLGYLELTGRAAHVFEDLADDASLTDALGSRAHVLAGIGRSDEALGVVERACELAVRLEDPWRESSCRRTIALCLAGGSTPVELAIARCEDQLAAAVWHEEEPHGVLRGLASLHAQAGRIDQARALGERDIAAIRKADAMGQLTSAIAWAGGMEHAAGNLGEAEYHLRSAYAILEAEDDRSLLPDVAGELACVLAQRGELEEAGCLARTARERAHANEFAAAVFWRRALALVASHEDHTDEALQLSEEARTRANTSDWLTFRGQTLEEAAEIRNAAGDADGAREVLHEALATYERKGNVVGGQRVQRRIESDAKRGRGANRALARSGPRA